MTSPELQPRRRLLAGLAGLVTAGGLAGCTGDGAGEDGDTGEPERETPGATTDTDADDTGDEPTAGDSETDEPTETPGTDELDLREANIVGVSVTEQGDGYRFDVSLHHDDDGEDGYANWWQVERLDGTQLGRRDLLHAHSQQPFTRSETVAVPDGVSCVVVRGHDQTHGYGGAAMTVDLGSGATATVAQGDERHSTGEADCP